MQGSFVSPRFCLRGWLRGPCLFLLWDLGGVSTDNWQFVNKSHILLLSERQGFGAVRNLLGKSNMFSFQKTESAPLEWHPCALSSWWGGHMYSQCCSEGLESRRRMGSDLDSWATTVRLQAISSLYLKPCLYLSFSSYWPAISVATLVQTACAGKKTQFTPVTLLESRISSAAEIVAFLGYAWGLHLSRVLATSYWIKTNPNYRQNQRQILSAKLSRKQGFIGKSDSAAQLSYSGQALL